jgi:hypothetical protein
MRISRMQGRMKMKRNEAFGKGNGRNAGNLARAVSLCAVLAIAGTFILAPAWTDAYPGMGKNCASCHKDGTSGSVQSRDASGAADVSFNVAPSATVTIIVAGADLPDEGAFVALVLGNSYDIVQSFTGAKNSGDPGTLYVVNADENDIDASATAVKASMGLTIKAGAADGDYQATAMLGYKGAAGVSQSSPVTIKVSSAPVNAAPVMGPPVFPASVYLNAPIHVSAPITDDGGVASATLFYKAPGSPSYTALNMSPSSGDAKNGVWSADIPGQASTGMLYFNINATDGALSSRSPAAGDNAVSVLAPGNPEITHAPVATGYIGTPIAVNATVKEAGSGVVLFYKGVGASSFASLPMNRTTGGAGWPADFTASIPAQSAKGQVAYYINASNGTLSSVTPEYRVQILSLWEPELHHSPVAAAYTAVETPVTASARNAASVVLWYKGVGESYFRSRDMAPAGAGPNGTRAYASFLPAQSAAGAMSYYINATNGTLYNSTIVYNVKISEALDLVLVDVSFSEKEPALHEELIIKAKVLNNSTRELSGVQVSFLDDYYPPGDLRYIGLVSNLTIPAKTTITVRAWWLPQVNGTHKIRVTVDSTGVVKETDEGNNELVREVDVGPSRTEGIEFPSLESFRPIWPVFAVAAGFFLGLLAFLARRKGPAA